MREGRGLRQEGRGKGEARKRRGREGGRTEAREIGGASALFLPSHESMHCSHWHSTRLSPVSSVLPDGTPRLVCGGPGGVRVDRRCGGAGVRHVSIEVGMT